MGVNITRQGIMVASSFNEALGSKYDMTTYNEPDGSTWIRIAHHNFTGSNLFSSTNTFASSVYIDENRWFNVSILNMITNNTYELMVKQKASTDTDEQKYRWVQYANPMTCTYDDVDVADVTINTSTEYSVAENYGGLYCKNENTYLCANNSKPTNWYGAIGAWKTTTSEKLPVWGATLTNGYFDLYVRIDNQPINQCSIFNSHIQANDFIEW